MLRIHMKQNVNNRESTYLKYLTDSKAFIEYSDNMDDIKILKNTIQTKNEEYWSYLMIWLLILVIKT